MRQSYLYNGNTYTGKTISLYWNGAQIDNWHLWKNIMLQTLILLVNIFKFDKRVKGTVNLHAINEMNSYYNESVFFPSRFTIAMHEFRIYIHILLRLNHFVFFVNHLFPWPTSPNKTTQHKIANSFIAFKNIRNTYHGKRGQTWTEIMSW